MKDIKYLAILGNILFIGWLFYNGVDEGFKASPMQLTSYLSLTGLLILNSYLLTRKK